MFSIIPYRTDHDIARRGHRGYFEDFANDFFRPFFADNFGMMTAQRPMRVDVKDDGDRYVLEADLPGVNKDALKVEVNDGVLTISAKYEQSEEAKNEAGKYVYRERRQGSMSRSFNVEGIQEDGITAEFKDGVLKLNLPKCAPEQKPEPHTIAIEG